MTIRSALLAMAAVAMLAAPAKADRQKNVLDLKHSLTDSSIVFPESYEADTQKMLEGWYMKNYTATDRNYEELGDVDTPDEVIIERLKRLPTVIEMPFNSVVRTYIDRYTSRSRAQVAALLGLSIYYMPVFEQALEEKGLPLELKYLPVIESGLNPNAVSRQGATGLWQFMLGTAKGLGMEVTSLVDERRDPYVASERAASYLKDLYDTYGDWSLAIAAYNCGPGNVNKALRRAGGDASTLDFWGIYNYLSPETRGYVPMFIAANYVMNYHQEHNISPVLATKPLVTDTVRVSERVHFNQISKVLDIPVEEIRILNPQFRADIIPGTPDSPYTLILPSQQIHAYLMSENEVKGYERNKYAQRGVVEPGDVPSDAMLAIEESVPGEEEEVDEVGLVAAGGRKSTVVHKVVAGETLASIADKYGVSVQQIKENNNLRRNAVRVGQQLKITTGEAGGAMMAETQSRAPLRSETAREESTRKASKSSSKKASRTKQKQQAKSTNHTIRNGESLSSISKKYGVSVDELKKANGMSGDKLRAGKTLKIPAKSSSKKKSSAKKSSRKKKSGKRRR